MIRSNDLALLLGSCEAVLARRLGSIRSRLLAEEWLGAVWELLLIEAASAIADVVYEPRAAGGRPDMQLNLRSGGAVLLEASTRESDHDPEVIEKTALYRTLDSKRKQMEKWSLDAPCVLCVGSPHSRSFAAQRQPLSAEQAAWAFFEDTGGELVSAVVVVPVMLEPKPLTGLARVAKPRIVLNGTAVHPLPEADLNELLRMDFNRWSYTHGSELDLDRRRWAVEHARSVIRTIDSVGPCWTFQQGFDLFRIVPRSSGADLLRRDELIAHFSSAEEAADSAASLFSSAPPFVFVYTSARRRRDEMYAPDSIEPEPSGGIPAALSCWRWEP